MGNLKASLVGRQVGRERLGQWPQETSRVGRAHELGRCKKLCWVSIVVSVAVPWRTLVQCRTHDINRRRHLLLREGERHCCYLKSVLLILMVRSAANQRARNIQGTYTFQQLCVPFLRARLNERN
jgi:hypothetical protein